MGFSRQDYWSGLPFPSPGDLHDPGSVPRASRVAQLVKNLPTMEDIWVRSLGREHPLEKGMAIHSSILAWSIPRTEEPSGRQSVGLQSGTRLSDWHQHSILHSQGTGYDPLDPQLQHFPCPLNQALS